MGVLYAEHGAVATVTIDNPPLNILDEDIREELMRRFELLKENQSIRVLILRGTGERSFSVGSNLRQFNLEGGAEAGVAKVRFEQRLHDLLESLPQVTIAVLRGFVLGGGCELMMPCNLRLAATDAVFGFPEVKVGGFPCSGGTQRLLHLVGPTKALEMLLLGENISAEDACRIGLITRSVPGDRLDETVRETAERLAQLPWLNLQAIKRCISDGIRQPDRGAAVEVEEYAKVFVSQDMREGVAAFLAKRPPRYQHK